MDKHNNQDKLNQLDQVFPQGAEFDPDERKSKFWEKAKKDPVVPIGIAGGLGVLGYQAYKFKNRGDTKVSVYLIHTRVAAQGAVIGALTLGVLFQMYKEFVLPKINKK